MSEGVPIDRTVRTASRRTFASGDPASFRARIFPEKIFRSPRARTSSAWTEVSVSVSSLERIAASASLPFRPERAVLAAACSTASVVAAARARNGTVVASPVFSRARKASIRTSFDWLFAAVRIVSEDRVFGILGQHGDELDLVGFGELG